MADRSFATLLRRLRQRIDPGAGGLSDGQLVTRFATLRDEAAFEALLERHGPMVLNLCRSVLRDAHAAEDAFQATFLVLACKAGSIRKRPSVASWLHGVARRVALRARARAARRPEVQVLAEPASPPAGDADLLELRWLLAEELQRLPEKYRAPLVLCYLEGKTNQAAARELGWPGGSMAKRLARGRELLRERLAAKGVGVTAGLLALCGEGSAPAAVPATLCEATLRAVALFAAGAAAPAAAPVALARGVLRAMSAAKLKLFVPLLLAFALAAGAAGRLAYQAHAAGRADETPTVLPSDPHAVVLLWDVRRADLPRQSDGPRLRVTADGTATALAPYATGRSAVARLSPDELQSLLRFVLREHGFFAIEGKSLGEQGRAGPATVLLKVQADGREHEVRGPDPSRLGGESPEAGHVRAIGERLERLAGWVYAGGREGVAAALEHANRQVDRDFPETPRLRADDFQSAEPRAGGGTEVVFERRGVAPDGNPFSFVYARLEVPAKGEPRVTVKADLASRGSNAEPSNKPKKGPLDVQPKPIATDPTVKYDYDIVYVRSPRKGDDKQIQWTEVFSPLRAEPGADLVLLHPNGKEELLVSGADGSVTDPFVSFDAEWVYYAKFNPPAARTPGSDVCKVHVKTKKVVKLTEQVFTPNAGVALAGKKSATGVFNLGPCPLPGGKVMFVSNRNGYAPTKGYTPTVLQLFTMDDDGSNVEQIGHLNINSALHPTILKDGRVMFTSYESQGLRDLRNWSVWTIHPDGTNWGPLYSALGPSGVSALHFMSQISDGSVVVEEYYNLNNQGFGTFYKMAPSAPPGEPYFGSAAKHDPRNISYQGSDYNRIPFSPRGIQLLTTFCDAFDRAARNADPKDPDSPRVGKVTHPSGAPDNHLLTVWSPGPVNSNSGVKKPAIDAGIYLIKSGRPVDEPGHMLLIKNDPNYNEQWPRALVPYRRIHGVDEPARLPGLKNDGKLHKALPEGTPFGLVGTSSLYKRESYPGGIVPAGKVTAGPEEGKDPFQGLGSLTYTGYQLNWFVQGADAGRYPNSDVHAVRILVTEPTTDPRNTAHYNVRFWNIAQERLRILGEFPVRKFGPDGKQPLDPDGNPDTSFLAKIPADLAWTFQTLDKNGMVLNMAQTWHQVRPGEVRTNCGGCHAHSQKPTDFNKTMAARPDYPLWDLTRKTPLLTTRKHDESGKKWDGEDSSGVRWARGVLNVEYYRDVRPIFQRSCAACHTEKAGKPAGNLVLDDDRPMKAPDSIAGVANGPYGKVPGTFLRLALDPRAQFGHKPPLRGWSHPQASRYVRYFQSRRSLLIWKVFGRRLDGWSNDDFAIETVPGDPNTLVYKGKPLANTPENERLFNLAYTGSVMPPPEAVAGSYEGPDGKKIKVAPLTDEDRLTLVRWIDLGCPIDLSFDPARPQEAGVNGWTLHDNRPTLTLTYPKAGDNPTLSRLLVGMHDYFTGLDLDSFQVTADFALDGTLAGENLAPKFKPAGEGVWECKLAAPITELRQGVLTVSVKNRQGNRSEMQRRFSVGAPRRGPTSSE